jgi:nucleoside-triphosphatase THEP1
MQPTNSPAALIKQIHETQRNSPQLWFVTGESGSGKTRWCVDLLTAARRAGLAVGGVLSLAVMVSRRKVAIDLLDVKNTTHRRLAVLHAWPGALPLSLTLQHNGQDLLPSAGRWRFDPIVLAWGNKVLRESAGAELLFVDEIGQLEFYQHGGLQAAIQILDAADYRTACVTLRPKLLTQAQQRWPTGRVVQSFPEGQHP